MEKLNILSIDIGIINLGFVYSCITIPELINHYSSKYKGLMMNTCYQQNKEIIKNNITILDCNRVNITHVKHINVQYCNCKLLHDNCIPDYLDHFIQEHKYMFDECDILLLERQPPVGITNVQDLLFTKFRSKVVLVSPNTVHSYFKMSSEYDTRKEESEKIANEYLNNEFQFTNQVRKHDISDALLMIIYYYKYILDEHIKKYNYNNLVDDFEKFRFK